MVRLYNFLENNHSFVRAYRDNYLTNLLVGHRNDPVQRMVFLYIDALRASYKGLTNIHEGVTRIYEAAVNTQQGNRLHFPSFFETLFGEEFDAETMLFEKLREGEFHGLGPKGCALFLRNLAHLQTFLPANIQIFSNPFPASFTDQDVIIPNNPVVSKIPVDSVIYFCYNTVTGTNLTNTEANFHRINDVFRNFGTIGNRNYFLFEDVWFWGYLSTQSIGGERQFLHNDTGINLDKFYADPSMSLYWSGANFEELRGNVRRFARLMQSLEGYYPQYA